MDPLENDSPKLEKSFSIFGYREFEKKLRITKVAGDIITLANGSKWQVSDLMNRPVEFEIGETVIVSKTNSPNPKICIPKRNRFEKTRLHKHNRLGIILVSSILNPGWNQYKINNIDQGREVSAIFVER